MPFDKSKSQAGFVKTIKDLVGKSKKKPDKAKRGDK